MPTTVVLTNVVVNNGTYFVRFNDGTELEFSSLQELQQFATRPDQDIDLTKNLCLAYLQKRSSDFSNITSVKDKNFIFDLSHGSPIRVQ